MSVFGNFTSAQVIDVAEKLISKMGEEDLACAIEQSERTMSSSARTLLIEAMFDAFRQRGESSEDAAEEAGTSLDAITRGDREAVEKLLVYARSNPGLLKDATVEFVERDPALLTELSPEIANAVKQRLLER
jgi:hypothetical protein